MVNNIIIRKAGIDDFEQIHRIVMQVHNLHLKNRRDIYKDVNPLTIDEFKEDITSDNKLYLVAESNENVVGICFSTIKIITDNRILNDKKIVYIENICVDVNERKKGIGKMLYNETIKIAKNIKANSIELMVWKFNEEAINFYKNLGMEIKNIRFEKKLCNFIDSFV